VFGSFVGAAQTQWLYWLVHQSILAGVMDMNLFGRQFCLALCWLLCVSLLAPAEAYATDGRSLMFDLLRKGRKVGSHSIKFVQNKDLLTVDISINIKGKVLFIPFTYVHSNREVWRGSVLQSLDSKTFLNGKPDTLSVRANNGGYDVDFDGKASRIEGDIKTTSYWHPATSSQARLLNSQTGKVIPLTLSAPVNIVAPTLSGSGIAAREVRMTDNKKFNANVAYDSQNCLVGLNFKAPYDGALIVYHMVTQPKAKAAPDLLANPLIAKCLAAG
jgi:Family of unknown function (DUF6134)